ncbi:protein phosphatase 2C domain-containing protein [Dyadobacter sp. CY261]|uniref:PP2C family protein-serine/threonine phosphatase n=1 Tax=Dyadobacter sp. CY261 TaxID=2907203 RepID=UPI001F42EFE5|nr:protein phosphatase 2C domain-containing protein [Dyadobacter sp. CY261]MCF0073494.1 protein phosphatase 2C domain-containing protein [Dyadobacter sp. CY261]
MKVQINQPVSVYGLGKRTNNEDNLFPPPGAASVSDTLFMVCDGVGGSEKGEVASELACRSVSGYYQRHRITVSDDASVYNAIAFAQAEMERYGRDNPGSQGMATTLTFLHLHERGATVAHIGDSRVYHVRNGKVLWSTRDHSYVNDLVKARVITEEQARTHPRRNVIMRALQGGDPDTQADVHHIADLAGDDYFFLCSDGILESLDENALLEILSAPASDDAKMEQVRKLCEQFSNDNFTAYLVPIHSVEMLTVELLPPETSSKKNETENESAQKPLNMRVWVIFAVLMFSSGWYFWHHRKPEPVPVKPQPAHVAVARDSVVVLQPVKPVKQGKQKPHLKKDKKIR